MKYDTKLLTFLVFKAPQHPFQAIGRRGRSEKPVTRYGLLQFLLKKIMLFIQNI